MVALFGRPIEFVGVGVEGSEGRTELRKATGFWIRGGDTGDCNTVCAWNRFLLGNVEGVEGNTESVEVNRECPEEATGDATSL